MQHFILFVVTPAAKTVQNTGLGTVWIDIPVILGLGLGVVVVVVVMLSLGLFTSTPQRSSPSGPLTSVTSSTKKSVHPNTMA